MPARPTFLQLQPGDIVTVARTLSSSAPANSRDLTRNTPATLVHGSHLEGDFIKRAGNKSSMVVLVERSSRVVLLIRMEDATANSALPRSKIQINSNDAMMDHSVSYDYGKEMRKHQLLTLNTDVRVHFSDPHCAWQRGTCEHTNGLLRQYPLKGAGRGVYSRNELNAIADTRIDLPRVAHNFKVRMVVFPHLLAMAQ